jgi:PncC family amidohydrolase
MEERLEVLVGQQLKRQGYQLLVAESCTGGLISHRLTNIPGSSEYFLGGVVVYAYEAKQKILSVKAETLSAYGAVSRETVTEMANGVRHLLDGTFEADKTIGLSVSGIAGPGGGIPGKPVGTVWIGLSAADGTGAWLNHFTGSRIEIKTQTAQAALQVLLDYLLGNFHLNG